MNWDALLDLLRRRMGFGERWCSWILTCGELDFDLYLHSQFSILDLDLIFLEADFFFL